MTVPRLYVDQPLGPDMAVLLATAQAHYVATVMRRRAGDSIALFNGRDGCWTALIERVDKRATLLRCQRQQSAQETPPDLWLLAAPLRKGRFEWVAEKACELGVSVLKPVTTRRTVPERLRLDRLRTIIVEAAEQCGRTSLTSVDEPLPLASLLGSWPADRHLLFCDEAGGPPLARALADRPVGEPWAILIGPEGGFDPEEREQLLKLPQAVPVSLGPRILRADTAAVAAISCWQALCGTPR
jgi:16S rRNA (uracil1498-N3)-methyltransferase